MALAGVASVSNTAVIAADPKAPTPDFEISGNFGLFSDYRFRGISQTNRDPALQGGFDVAHKSGIYVGTWGSNVSRWANPGGSMEIDVYGGYSTELPWGIGLDIGHIWYEYPGNDPAVVGSVTSNDSREWYLGLSYGWVSYKFSRATTTWFGVPESKGSYYHSLGLEYSPVEKLTLSATAGSQKVKGLGAGNNISFKDYSVGGSYDLGDGYSVGLTYHRVSFKEDASKQPDGWFATTLDGAPVEGATDSIFKNAVVFSFKKDF